MAKELPLAQTETWFTKNDKTFEYFESNINIVRFSEEHQSYFNCLPDELIINIFAYLTTKELCQCVAPVCKKWQKLSYDHSLWKELDFSHCQSLSSVNFLCIIRRAPLLHRLVVSGRREISGPEIDIATEFCHAINEIDFGFCDNLDKNIIHIVARNCHNLKKINVEGCASIKHDCLKYLVHCKQLTDLNFSHCTGIEDAGVKYLSKYLPKIVSINLDGINFITDSCIICLTTHHHCHLEYLELDGAEISDEGMKCVARCLKLKHLGLSFCECLSDKSFEYIKELLNLEYLRLRKGCEFHADNLCKFFQEASLKHLKTLNLSECTYVNDAVVLAIAQRCGSNLVELALSWCWSITDVGLVSIMDHCSDLLTLDLLGIDKIQGDCLHRIPEEMSKLTLLDLRHCNKIVDSTIEDVVRRKPDLKVYNYYGEEFVHE